LIGREVQKRGRDPKFALTVRRAFNTALAFWLWEQGGVSTVSLSAVPAALCREATRGIRHDYDDIALRKELTAGCLIEKAAGTIFFGHRSLQEFLTAERLIETNLTSRGNRGSVDIPYVLTLLNPEIINFIVDAARSSPKIKEAASDWFSLFRGLRRTGLSRAGMRLFVDLATVAGVEVPEQAWEPWSWWFRYFIGNRVADFSPRSAAAADNVVRILARGLLRDEMEVRAAVLLLSAHVLAAPSPEGMRIAPNVLAHWLNAERFGELIRTAQGIGRGEFAYVRREEDLALWSFLRSARIGQGEGGARIEFNANGAVERLKPIIRMGFDDDLAGREGATPVHVSPQAIYRIWDLRNRDLEIFRAYFSDEGLRAKIKPLEVDVVPSRPAPMATKRESPRETLKLKPKRYTITRSDE
jgi:hypothetical protein